MPGGWVASICADATAGGVPRLEIIAGHLASRLSAASVDGLQVVFDGRLDNRADVAASFPGGVEGENVAQLLARGYRSTGDRLIDALRGAFVLLVHDEAAAVVLAVRDQLGLAPLYWVTRKDGFAFSPSVGALLDQPGVSGAFNRPALADHLCHRWPVKDETFYTAVKRVPPGHVARVRRGSIAVTRYWTPVPPDGHVNWLKEDDLSAFDALLERAVLRAVGTARPGILLSGGLDSISVATVAADLARDSRLLPTVALSLGFLAPDCDERDVQREVAAALGLEQVLLPFDQAVGREGLLPQTLRLGARRPAPLLNTWEPAYRALLREGRKKGVEVVLTGGGGDEWLTVTPYLAADLLLARDVGGLFRLAGEMSRSVKTSPIRVARTIWRFGARPVLGRALHRAVPSRWHRNRLKRVLGREPSWIAPDPAVRRALVERTEQSMLDPDPPGGFYLQEMRAGLDHALTSWEQEENAETARELGIEFRHPYWDADLVEFLVRTPPSLLSRGGRAKGLVRSRLDRRLPGLGLARQKKVAATSFYRETLARECPALWDATRPSALADLGIVDLDGVNRHAEKVLSGWQPEELYAVYGVLSLERWVRARGTGPATRAEPGAG